VLCPWTPLEKSMTPDLMLLSNIKSSQNRSTSILFHVADVSDCWHRQEIQRVAGPDGRGRLSYMAGRTRVRRRPHLARAQVVDEDAVPAKDGSQLTLASVHLPPGARAACGGDLLRGCVPPARDTRLPRCVDATSARPHPVADGLAVLPSLLRATHRRLRARVRRSGSAEARSSQGDAPRVCVLRGRAAQVRYWSRSLCRHARLWYHAQMLA
jgi:hypothetical protein